jgi:hypothetical protein
VSKSDLFVLYIPAPEGEPELIMGGDGHHTANHRTMSVRGTAVNYARKHGAKVVRLHFPATGDPYVAEIIDPAESAKP